MFGDDKIDWGGKSSAEQRRIFYAELRKYANLNRVETKNVMEATSSNHTPFFVHNEKALQIESEFHAILSR